MSPMYMIHSSNSNRWRIVDRSNRLVFVGDKQQAEEWLDWQDNAQPHPSALGDWFRGIVESTARPFAHLWRRSQARPAHRVS
jgi:hypothetical protein